MKNKFSCFVLPEDNKRMQNFMYNLSLIRLNPYLLTGLLTFILGKPNWNPKTQESIAKIIKEKESKQVVIN